MYTLMESQPATLENGTAGSRAQTQKELGFFRDCARKKRFSCGEQYTVRPEYSQMAFFPRCCHSGRPKRLATYAAFDDAVAAYEKSNREVSSRH
jgi:hypothetical protein